MAIFYKTKTGAFCCDFTVDQSDPRFAGIDDMLPEHVAERIAEFAPSALPDRTYDAESVCGHAISPSDIAQYAKALAAVTSLPDSPMVVVPGSNNGKDRYALRPSIIKEVGPLLYS